jgi:hypothetical protein
MKNELLSAGRYAVVMVLPQLYKPLSGWRLPVMISKKAVTASLSREMKAILSPLRTLIFTFENRFAPSADAARFSI